MALWDLCSYNPWYWENMCLSSLCLQCPEPYPAHKTRFSCVRIMDIMMTIMPHLKKSRVLVGVPGQLIGIYMQSTIIVQCMGAMRVIKRRNCMFFRGKETSYKRKSCCESSKETDGHRISWVRVWKWVIAWWGKDLGSMC